MSAPAQTRTGAVVLAAGRSTRFRSARSKLVHPLAGKPIITWLLDTLAAAYAAAGKFPQAVNTAEAALRLAESSNQSEKADDIKNRISFYKESKPYIESERK